MPADTSRHGPVKRPGDITYGFHQLNFFPLRFSPPICYTSAVQKRALFITILLLVSAPLFAGNTPPGVSCVLVITSPRLGNLTLVPAKKSDAEPLSNLAFRSKAHWPYSARYLEACKATLRVTPDYIRAWPIEILVREDGKWIGFYSLNTNDGIPTLDNLWVEPEFIGNGAGGILFEAAVRKGTQLGWTGFRIIADPMAEPFYLHVGAKRIGEVESKYQKGLFLPVMSHTWEGI